MGSQPFADEIRETAPVFGLDLDDETVARFVRHYEMLVKWNVRLNLTRIVDPAEAARQHFLESCWLATRLPSAPNSFLDVGSGAGFPGLPLACLWPDASAILVEPNAKRSVFLKEVVRALDLPRVAVVTARFNPSLAQGNDLLAARALDKFADLAPRLLECDAATVAFFSDEGLLSRAALLDPSRSAAIARLPESKQRFLGVFSRIRST